LQSLWVFWGFYVSILKAYWSGGDKMTPLPKECPIGPQRKRKRTPKKYLEGAVVRECLQFLAKHPDVIYVERRNTGAVRFQDGGFIRFGSVGAADVWCLVKRTIKSEDGLYGYIAGRPATITRLTHVEIECKRADGKGRQSADQKKFQNFCNNRHIPYILCTSTKQLADQIKAICS